MEAYCDQLQTLKKNIPYYSEEGVQQLDNILFDFRKIMFDVLKDEKYEKYDYLRSQTPDIEFRIRFASDRRNRNKDRQDAFRDATIDLGLCIDSLIEALDCGKD